MSNKDKPGLIVHRPSDIPRESPIDDIMEESGVRFTSEEKDDSVAHNDELRAWARGSYTAEAATELLIRAFDGRFAAPGNPWIHQSEISEASWINFARIPEHVYVLSGGESRYLRLVASIAAVEVSVDLGEVLAGLERDLLVLVLAAIAHASGSHEHSGSITYTDGTESIERLFTLHPWPDEG